MEMPIGAGRAVRRVPAQPRMRRPCTRNEGKQRENPQRRDGMPIGTEGSTPTRRDRGGQGLTTTSKPRRMAHIEICLVAIIALSRLSTARAGAEIVVVVVVVQGDVKLAAAC